MTGDKRKGRKSNVTQGQPQEIPRRERRRRRGLAFGAVPLRLARAEGKIVVGVEAGSPYETFYAKHAPEFTKATGVAVEFISIPHDNIRQQFVQDALAAAGGFDVYIADQVWLPEFYEKGFIVDLTSGVSDADRGDFSKTAIETVSYNGRDRGAADHGPQLRHVLSHRPAQGRRLRRAAARPGTSTARWPRRRPRTAIWGTMILSKQGIEAATRLNAFYQQAGSDIIDADGKATIDTDAGHAALEFMTGAVFEDKSAPEGVLELPDMQGAWLDGKLALAPVWPYLYSLSKEPLGNTFSIGTAPGNPNPGGTVYSWGFAAAAGSKNPDAALEWVKWSTSTDQLYNFGKEWLNPVPRASAIDKIAADPDIADSDKAAISAFAASAAAGKSMPMVPQYSQLLDVLGIIQSGVMSKAMSIDDALKDGQMRAEAVMAG